MEIGNVVGNLKDFAKNFAREIAALGKRYTDTKDNLDAHMDQFRRSVDQHLHGQISDEELKRVIAKKNTAAQEVQTVEASIEQLGQAKQKHHLFTQANTNDSCYRELIQEYLSSVIVKNGNQASVHLQTTLG